MAKKLETPEELKAAKSKVSAEYLKHAEDVMSELLGPLFGADRIQGNEDVDEFMYHAIGVRQLAMALRRFPKFDISCLSSMKKFTYSRRVGSEDVKLDVMVPTFATVDYRRLGEAQFSLHTEQNFFEVGKTQIRFSFEMQRENVRRYERESRFSGGGWDNGRVIAKPPAIPRDVKSRVQEAEQCFEHLMFVWEAEWQNAPVQDPLIIGTVLGNHFLVDKYDTTKLERYISSEMTSGPAKE